MIQYIIDKLDKGLIVSDNNERQHEDQIANMNLKSDKRSKFETTKDTHSTYELTLEYILKALENITYIENTRKSLDCPLLFNSIIKLFNEKMPF